MTTATVHPKTGFHLAGRPINLAGRQVLIGQPVPEAVVTWTLLELEWIVPASREEYDAAVLEHGEPPAVLFVGWDFVKNGAAPPRTKTNAKQRKRAKRKKARSR